jgi:hypothetical protein
VTTAIFNFCVVLEVGAKIKKKLRRLGGRTVRRKEHSEPVLNPNWKRRWENDIDMSKLERLLQLNK